MEIAVVDLFCGIGGLTHGFVLERIKVIAGIDSDPSCRYAYEENNGARFIHQGVEKITPTEIAALYPANAIRVLVGCAPCQPYSTYAHSTKVKAKDSKEEAQDNKWDLLAKFGDLIEAVEPDVVSMENVPALRRYNQGEVYRAFVERLEQKEYHVTEYIAYCPNYGIPQKRRRLVLFASKFGPVALLNPTHAKQDYRTVAATIGHLPAIEAGITHPADPLHRARALTDINLRRIRQSKPGGTWRDWDEDLRARCHTKEGGASYDSVYGRMKDDEPSPTITTQCYGYGSGRFGHPTQDRALSIREAALLQTFPEDYAFFDETKKWHARVVGRHIGNAVPVELGRVIAQSIKKHIE